MGNRNPGNSISNWSAPNFRNTTGCKSLPGNLQQPLCTWPEQLHYRKNCNGRILESKKLNNSSNILTTKHLATSKQLSTSISEVDNLLKAGGPKTIRKLSINMTIDDPILGSRNSLLSQEAMGRKNNLFLNKQDVICA